MSKALMRPISPVEYEAVVEVINDAAKMYEGVVAEDALVNPYMTRGKLVMDIAMGAKFWCVDSGGNILGVMAIQVLDNLSLIRHAYVKSNVQRKGVGSGLLKRLMQSNENPTLIGTWRAADWAISFYKKFDFKVIDGDEKDQLLSKYWKLGDRHMEESVILADSRWFEMKAGS